MAATRLIPGGPVIRSLEYTSDGALSSVNYTTGYDPPGMVVQDTAGCRYKFVQATTDAIASGSAVVMADTSGYLVTDDSAAGTFTTTGYNPPAGVAIGTISAGRWGWIQTWGYKSSSTKVSLASATYAIAQGEMLYANHSTHAGGSIQPYSGITRTVTSTGTTDDFYSVKSLGMALAAASSETTTGPAIFIMVE